MYFPSYIKILTIIVYYILIIKTHDTNGYPNEMETTISTTKDVYDEVNNIKINLRKINFELDSLHNK